ncbi:MAG: SPASM domain-containing protein, partial [Thermodesulfobacterium sp.]|nr:SPASM domain-containing protein [Thermodesulfobacterium sp.]
PIGRGKNVFDLMPSPEQRMMLYRKWEKLLEKGYPIADFWNSGPLADGCIAFGRKNGYFYIDWNGYITPCVFIPYYVDNVYDLYKKGKTLADAWNNLFFKNGRQWQKEYGYPYSKNAKNWLMPCAIRDNYHTFRTKIFTPDVKPENQEAEEAMNSEEYYQKLIEYDKQLEAITLPIWQNEYLKNSS